MFGFKKNCFTASTTIMNPLCFSLVALFVLVATGMYTTIMFFSGFGKIFNGVVNNYIVIIIIAI